MKLRDYQEECIQEILSAHSKRKFQQLIVLPTGSGKTVILWSLLKRIGKKALIIAHTKELIDQLNDTVQRIFPHHNCVVCSIQSTQKRIDDLKSQNFDILVIDEAHHALANSYKNLINRLGFTRDSSKLLLGFTATPNRGDGHSALEVFPHESYRLDIDYMIDNQYLCDVKGYRIQTGINLSKIRICKGDFVNHALVSAINTKQRNALAFDSYEKLGENKKCIAFCASIEHAEELADEFRSGGLHCEAVHGKLEKNTRNKRIKSFNHGNLQVITNCQLLTEGFDAPCAEVILMARPTASTALYIQMIGRGLRTYPGKTICQVIELTDNCHKLCNLSHLSETTHNLKELPRDGESLTEYRKRVKKPLLASTGRPIVQTFDLIERQNKNEKWANSEPTELQLKFLQENKIKWIPPLSRDMASLMISNFTLKKQLMEKYG